jgi:uncharacterized protein YdeI (YjbR/CyaY-like superfamily)
MARTEQGKDTATANGAPRTEPATAPADTATPPANHVAADSRAAWRRWLKQHHKRAEGVWLVTWKKASGGPHLSYDDAVEEALAWGWVDSKPGKLDALRTMLWMAPRKGKTGWSRPNQQRVARLLAAGLMQPAGLAKVHAAQADGTWSKLDAVEDGVVPEDLVQALAAHPPASDYFMAFPRSVKRGILEWIEQAKRPETRAQRVLNTATLAQRNERANQWKGRQP